MVDVFALMYSFLPLVNSIAYFPQVIKLFRSSAEEVRSVSLSAWFMWLCASFVTLMYGITNLHDPLFIIVASVGLFWNTMTIMITIWKRQSDFLPLLQRSVAAAKYPEKVEV